MARSAPRPVVAKKKPTATGAAKFGEFQNPDMTLRGYWLYEERPITVEVPILPHGFYPKLGHADYEIRQNIIYRRVEVPSISELRQHGIDVFKAFFVAEVVVHPRHIKNWNYFRGDFPAAVKAVAHNNNVLIILPANDMPSGRLVRKEVLDLWRKLFTPLFIKGHHYTSGRMSMFMAAPPNSLNRMKSALNLEQEEEPKDNLQEWYPAVGRVHVPRKRGPRPIFSGSELLYAEMIASSTTERMKDQLLPVLNTKLAIEPHSEAAEDLRDYISSPSTSAELLRATNFGKKPSAVNAWIKERMIPKLKEIVKEEGAQAAEYAFRNLLSFAFSATISAVLNNILKDVKSTKTGEALTKPITWQPQVHISPSFGLGSLKVTPKDAQTPINLIQAKQRIIQDIALVYANRFSDPTPIPFEQILIVNIGKDNKVTLALNFPVLAHLGAKVPEHLGKLHDKRTLEVFKASLTAWAEKYTAFVQGSQSPDYGMFGVMGSEF